MIFPSSKRFKPELNYTAKGSDTNANISSDVDDSASNEEENKTRISESEYEINLNDVR